MDKIEYLISSNKYCKWDIYRHLVLPLWNEHTHTHTHDSTAFRLVVTTKHCPLREL